MLGEVGSPMLGDVKLGFTGHRHDDELGLIDMKGRVFDPAQKRFLTPDPHVPDPLSGQSYNRYSYVTNNPLRYTDPTGFQPAAGDLKTQRSGSQPGGGAAAPTPAPLWPVVKNAAETLVIARLTDVDQPPPPPPPPTQEEQDGKWTELMKHMGWAKGAAKQLISMLPPVIVARQIRHNFQVARAAVSHAREGDWDLAGAAILEIPQQAAEGVASIVTGPIEAALEVPDDIQVAIDSGADPEQRGAAAIGAGQKIAIVVTTLVGAGAAAKAKLSGKLHGNNLNTTKPAEGYSLRDAATGDVLKYGETTLGTKRYSKAYLERNGAHMKFEASGTKRQMHDWQHQKIVDYKAKNGGQRPPLNKSDY